MSLTDNHRRHVLSSLAYVDGLLSEAEALVVGAETSALFPANGRDLNPAQRQATAAFIARFRQQLRKTLQELDIAVPEAKTSSAWTIRAILMSLTTIVEELRPRHLRGYGDLDMATAETLDGTVEALQQTLLGFLHALGGIAEDAAGNIEEASLCHNSPTPVKPPNAP